MWDDVVDALEENETDEILYQVDGWRITLYRRSIFPAAKRLYHAPLLEAVRSHVSKEGVMALEVRMKRVKKKRTH
ncbi:hypothetical protein PV327_005985 [Microctonus hyperodae]|uniref:Uncharacterized protein n=1 Tax=Microctonus hyperodae TaxID=165561 RepID=A0AA39G3B6_MICHY|nr:hypothetical protein PV327_005985 [Microctonus hyperodae]